MSQLRNAAFITVFVLVATSMNAALADSKVPVSALAGS